MNKKKFMVKYDGIMHDHVRLRHFDELTFTDRELIIESDSLNEAETFVQQELLDLRYALYNVKIKEIA